MTISNQSDKENANEKLGDSNGNSNLQDDVDTDGDEFDADDDEGNEVDGENMTGNDGLAEMMSKILNQKTHEKNPILAKRKTQFMKDYEEYNEQKEENKLHRLERKRKRENFLVLPDTTTLDFERQLRKVATRGVVALFNAISETKRTAGAPTDSNENTKSSSSTVHSDFKELAKKKFQSRLKDHDKDVQAEYDTEKQIHTKLTRIAHPKRTHDSNRRESDSQNGLHTKDEDTSITGARKWSVLRDSTFEKKKLSLKNWDKDDSDNE